jgi:hypothetical protein
MRFFSRRAFLATPSVTVGTPQQRNCARLAVIALSPTRMVANIHPFAADEQHALLGPSLYKTI